MNPTANNTLWGLALAFALTGCTESLDAAPAGQVAVDVWADNWFAMYTGETLAAEDSVSIATERSFNAEQFTIEASYPLEINVVLKDFKEDDTGLEYIGEANQQMGDGGFIAQFVDETGEAIGATDASWKCLVIHRGPLDTSCENDADPTATCTFESVEEPAGWKTSDYDTSSWSAATVYTESEVSPKDGYDDIYWDDSAELIWTSSLTQDNTLLCKTTIAEP